MRTEETSRTDGTLEPAVVLLHGFDGLPDDLAPFARSLSVSARFFFPEAPEDLRATGMRGKAWWAVDVEKNRGPDGMPGDISDADPPGLPAARACVDAKLAELAAELAGRPLVLGGFSQGAMLTCDWVLRCNREVAGLALFSGARIAADAWRPLLRARKGLRVFVSHGSMDRELSFASAESFQAELGEAGWDVTWVPFTGGHEIPLVVWRAFKRWLMSGPQSSRP